MAARENVIEAHARWAALGKVQKEYGSFRHFLYDVIHGLMGFVCTPVQIDIGDYLSSGPIHRMVQAQRGQAKTTIAAAYAVWRLIHNPTTRVLIISAGGPMAKEIANWIIQIIENMPILECLRPDKAQGDRESVEAYDIHYSLKGPEKSPSVACIGITGNLQGKRADILIADDIESQKNSQTQIQRERIKLLSKDFTSICSTGDIIYLGTPQSIDSIYNDLPGRGYDIRIWPGRYPTAKELPNYGNFLAPSLLAIIQTNPAVQNGGGPMGDRGQPIDPILLGEEVLTSKEIDQGSAYFQLQHMLDTRLMDAERFPLKIGNLVFMSTNDRAPFYINWSTAVQNLIEVPMGMPIKDTFYRGMVPDQTEWGAFTGCHMRIDPSGGGKNGDEFAYAVTKFSAGYIHAVDVGGMLGGPTEENRKKLTAIVAKWKPQQIDIEENYGGGAFRLLWQPDVLKVHKCALEPLFETGQKELRIIDCLETIINAHQLIISEELLRQDIDSTSHYPIDTRMTYSLFWQLARITRDKHSLTHDDRLDALAGSVKFWLERLAQDKSKLEAMAKQAQWNKIMTDPLGTGVKLNLRGPNGEYLQTKRKTNFLYRAERKHGRHPRFR